MKNNKLPKQMVIILSIFLLAVNGTLGVLLTNQSKNSLQDQMRKRMLDIANSAAALIDGEKQVPLGVSKGAAYFIKDSDTDIKAIFHRADEAMYADKAAWYTKHGDRRKR